MWTEERRYAAETLPAEGAVLLGIVDPKDPPHVVITRSVRSPKYRAAMRVDPTIPAVDPRWLEASLAAGRPADYAPFRVPLLLGVTVCFSGMATR